MRETIQEKSARAAFTREEQRWLLELARAAIGAATEGAPLGLDSWGKRLPSEQVSHPGAAFVSLHHCGALRGCVGCLQAQKPLYLMVADCAIAAARHDPRFAPVAPAEIPELKIEISVLSALFRLAPEEVKPGEHGLYITEGFRHGALLPQVAAERGWDRVRFLEETCAKAGLPRDAWQRGAQIEAFTALVFSDDEPA